MSAQGYPDWGRPRLLGDVAVWWAHEEPGVVVAPPDAVEPVGDDGPGLGIDVVDQDRGAAGIVTFAMVTAGFGLRSPVERARRVAGDVVVRPAAVTRGLVRLTAPADIGLPADALAVQPFTAAGGRTLRTTVRLQGVAIELLVGAVGVGLRALGATVWLELPGVATRCAGRLVVDVPALLAAAHERWAGPVPVDELADWFAAAAAGPVPGAPVPGVRVDGAADVPAHVLGPAVRDRVLSRLGGLAAPDDGAPVPVWSLPAAAPPGTTTSLLWDLTDPVLAPRAVALRADPVRVAGPSEVVVTRHAVAALTDGRHRVEVRATVPPRAAGVLDVAVDLTAPPAPPVRPFPVHATTTLPTEPGAAGVVTLQLAPREPLVYDLRTTTVLEEGLLTLVGPTRRLDDPTPVITPADLGVTFVPVEAARSLLAVADVVVAVTARLPDAGYRAQVRLTPTGSAGHLALPDGATDVALTAVAEVRATGTRTAPQPLPVGSVWLDLFSFGDPAHPPPWASPGPTGPDGPSGPDGPTRGDDTAPREQDRDPEVAVPTVELAGLRLTPAPPDAPSPGPHADGGPAPRRWTYAPLTAGVARGPDGAAQLAFLDAGGFASLSVTTALRLTDEQLDEAARGLADRFGVAPGELELRPDPVVCDGVDLLVGDGARPLDPTAGSTVLASASTSGSGTHDAAFSVVLTPEQAEAVRRGVAGERGRLGVSYRLRLPAGRSASTSRSSSSTSTTTTTTTTTATTTAGAGTTHAGGTTTTTERSDTGGTDAAAPVLWTVTSDAATWGLTPGHP